MAFRVRRKSNVNVIRVGMKIATTVIGLYAGGFLLNSMGRTMNGTTSPFNQGLTLIGWTVDSNGLITSTTGNSGILAIVGLLAIVWIVFEFVDINM